MRVLSEHEEAIPLTWGETQVREVDLEATEFLHVRAVQDGVDVALTLGLPGAPSMLRVDSPNGRFGPEELIFIAPAAGRYQLGLEAPRREAPPGSCRVRVVTKRPATEADRAVAAADSELREARRDLKEGRHREAAEKLRRALVTFLSRGPRSRQADTLAALGESYEAMEDTGQAVESLHAAVERYREELDLHALARLLCHSGFLELRLGRLREALSSFDEARDLAERLHEESVSANALWGLGSTYQALGNREEAFRYLGQALQAAQQTASLARQAALLSDLGSAHLTFREPEEAWAEYQQAAHLYSQAGETRPLPGVWLGLADSASRLGRHDEAEEWLSRALSALELQNSRRELALAHQTRAELLRRKGNLGEAQQAYEKALVLAREAGDRRTEGVALLGAGVCRREQGDPQGALELLNKAELLFAELGDQASQERATLRKSEALSDLGALAPGTGLDLSPGSIEDPVPPPTPANLARSDTPEGGGPAGVLSPEVRSKQERARQAALAQQRRLILGSAAPAIAPLEPALERPSDLDPELLGRWVWQTLGRSSEAREAIELGRDYEKATEEEILARGQRRELPFGTNPHSLEETGWACIYSSEEDQEVLANLETLFEHRSNQAGNRFRRIDYRPGETVQEFLWFRHGESPGVLNVDALPYYLLIIGGPDKVPFELQYQLSINHAVGRICFEQTEDYETYARQVVAAEKEGTSRPRQATIFAVENTDWVTRTLAEHLAAPLAKSLDHVAGWSVDMLRAEKATKASFAQLLANDQAPGVLLVSCHGKRVATDHPDQRKLQGALVCQGEPPGTEAAPDPRLFAAEDLPDFADLSGLVVFLFPCYGAGTPVLDNFPQEPRAGEPRLEPRAALVAEASLLTSTPFVAALPEAMLKGGALAVVGHVDRGWTTSFHWEFRSEGQSSAQPQTVAAIRSLEDSLKQLLSGHRLGHAMRPLHRRYSNLAALLTSTYDAARSLKELDTQTAKLLGWQWTAHHDARNFIILGDPAVYALGRPPEGTEARWEAAQAGRVVALDESLLARLQEVAQAEGRSAEDWVSDVLWQKLEHGESEQ